MFCWEFDLSEQKRDLRNNLRLQESVFFSPLFFSLLFYCLPFHCFLMFEPHLFHQAKYILATKYILANGTGIKEPESRVAGVVADLLAKLILKGALGHQQEYYVKMSRRNKNGKVVCNVSLAWRFRKRG